MALGKRKREQQEMWGGDHGLAEIAGSPPFTEN
ncbi:MAG: hypothetical protein KatS3mg105_2609 [Gemmatales bacterium]|nr:MAG: hypothetical protein KatS3mg105_2609 [Gemmatales bacterium]